MKIATSKITAQGQVSIPLAVRRHLGLAPGATIEWEEDHGTVSVRRAGRYSSADIHAAVFGKQPPQPVSAEEMDEAIAARMKEKYARG